MANLTYKLNGKSPAKESLDYSLEDGDLISTRPINFKLTVQMDPDHPNPVDGKVILQIDEYYENFYCFKNGINKIIVNFQNKTQDFQVEIESKIIMKKDNTNNFPLLVYLSVIGGEGNSFPQPISNGKHEWKKGDVTLSFEKLMDVFMAVDKNLNEVI